MKDISIILPVINETFSLEETVDILMKENQPDIKEIIAVVAKITAPESLAVIQKLQNRYPSVIKLLNQSLPYLGGAMRDAFEVVQGDWVVMMASDLETNPHTVKDFIQEIRSSQWDIITATRWSGGGFSSYNPIKLVLNFVFQKFFQLLYRTQLNDLTFGFRIFRTDLVKKIKWEELKHPFLLETILKPLKLGYRIKQMPSAWQARKEGESQNTFWRNFEYFKIGFRVLFAKKTDLIK